MTNRSYAFQGMEGMFDRSATLRRRVTPPRIFLDFDRLRVDFFFLVLFSYEGRRRKYFLGILRPSFIVITYFFSNVSRQDGIYYYRLNTSSDCTEISTLPPLVRTKERGAAGRRNLRHQIHVAYNSPPRSIC